jgi:hypothetical protein
VVKSWAAQMQLPSMLQSLLFAWRFRRNRWGLLATSIITLGLICFFVLGLVPARNRLVELEALHVTPAAFERRPLQKEIGPDIHRTLELFQRTFPPRSLLLDLSGQLNEAADKSGLHLAAADYRMIPDASGLLRYVIDMSARGNYVQVRRFVAACLTGFPTLTLDGVTLSRLTANESTIDTQFHFSLYLAPD